MQDCKQLRSSKTGTLTSGMNILVAIILIIAALLVFLIFFKNAGDAGSTLTGGITSNLTDLVAG